MNTVDHPVAIVRLRVCPLAVSFFLVEMISIPLPMWSERGLYLPEVSFLGTQNWLVVTRELLIVSFSHV